MTKTQVAKTQQNITQKQAYRRVEKLAKEAGQSVSAYSEARGVSRFYISKWKKGDGRTIPLDMAIKLGLV